MFFISSNSESHLDRVINEWDEIEYDWQEPNPVNTAEKVNGKTWVFNGKEV